MVEDVEGHAKAKIREHEAEAARWRDFLAMYHSLSSGRQSGSQSPKLVGERTPRGAQASVIVDAAMQVIIRHGSPMTRFQLVPAIEEVGVSIGGTDKSRNLGTILWRSKKFESTGEGYWPIGRPRPPQQSLLDDDNDL